MSLPIGKLTDLLWTYNTDHPRQVFVEKDTGRKYNWEDVKDRIKLINTKKTYKYYRWLPSCVPCDVHEVSVEYVTTEKRYLKHLTGTPTPDLPTYGESPLRIPMDWTKFGEEHGFKPKPSVPLAPPLPTTSNRTKSPKKWPEQLQLCLEAGLTRMLIVGPPGTGKTTAAASGHKYSVTCHEAMGPESMIGMFILRSGETAWVDGPATQAMRTGQRLILNEIDRTSGECTSLLYALMDDAPAIMLPTGDYVTAQTGYSIIGTSNNAPNDMPEAILDRIEAVLLAIQPHEGAIEAIRTLAPDDVSGKVSNVIRNYYNSLSKDSWKFTGKATIRRMFSFSKLLKYGTSEKTASQLVFGQSGDEILSAMGTASK